MYNQGYGPGGMPMGGPTGNPMQMQMTALGGQQQMPGMMPPVNPMMNNVMAPPMGGMPPVNGGPMMAGAGAVLSGPSMHLQAMAVNPALQMMYQQYALRWAAMQKMAADSQVNGMGAGMGPGMGTGMGPGMGPGMGGGMMNAGMMGGGMMVGDVQQGVGMGMHAGQGMPAQGLIPMQKPAGSRAPIHTYSSSQGLNQQAHTEDPALFYKTRLCHKWRDGHCPFPDCKYAHGEQELRTVEQNQATLQPQGQQQQWARQQQQQQQVNRTQTKGLPLPKDTRSALHKTRLCDEFIKTGSCKYGDRCTFAHGDAELREAPPALTAAPGAKAPRGVLWKTQLCDRFMKTGSCSYGDRCTFAHGEVELKRAGGGGGGGTQGSAQQQQQQLTYRSPTAHNSNHHHNNPTSSKGDHDDVSGQEQQVGQGGSSGAVYGPGEVQAQAEEAQGDGLHQEGVEEQGVEGSGVEQAGADDTDGYALGDVYGKRCREEEEEEGAGEGAGEQGGEETALNMHKRIHLEEDTSGVEPDCPLCAHLVRQGRNKLVSAISSLDSKQAQQVGSLVLAAATRLDQLWEEVTPEQLTRLMDKEEGLTLMDRIDLLHALAFHTHVTEAAGRTPGGGLGLDSQQYVEQGMPPACADFVYMVMQGREGTASMSEYFSMLEVCRQMYGLTDDSCLSRIMIGL